ncbi:MAG: three-Cys-motif partner protein TcmP [Bacteroidia bacterium]|nr:three-Cys-motif partner protein TcmP [Bacteroidia bacterium]
MESHPNTFGGWWTEKKIEIFLKYLYAYLEIMKHQRFKLIYFDGFAGCGTIQKPGQETEKGLLESVAVQVLGMNHPKRFDYYYMVEKDPQKAQALRDLLDTKFPAIPGVTVVEADCNKKLQDMAVYLQREKYARALCFIDPFGMSLDWASLEALNGLGVDIWLLVPTGIGVNRMLTKNGRISEAWLAKLERFWGLQRSEIMAYFYETKTHLTLFGPEEVTDKKDQIIQRIAERYAGQLKKIFNFVSKPFPMANATGSVMYHFLLATQNANGLKIGNDIIGKELGQSA